MKKIFYIVLILAVLVMVDSVVNSSRYHTTPVSPPASTTATYADPDQSMNGTYCDRLAAVGGSMVSGRNKGTQRTTVEEAITNTANITETERVMYWKMVAMVYDDPSITQAGMAEHTRKACQTTVDELTVDSESDRE
jgi:hypothetical protein